MDWTSIMRIEQIHIFFKKIFVQYYIGELRIRTEGYLRRLIAKVFKR